MTAKTEGPLTLSRRKLILLGASALAIGMSRRSTRADSTNLPPNVATAPKGMVASVHPLATDAGVAALQRGGNAMDAAIATALTLGVVDGHNSGPGGGCFILVRAKDGTVTAIDGREKA